jgi:ChrR Cupin-like domain
LQSGDAEVNTGMTDQNFSESLGQEKYCFCDLAPLYALELLNDDERQWVEQQILACPDLAIELTEYQTAVTAIPYGVESLPTADRMQEVKGKLCDRLDLTLSAVEPEPISNFVPFLALRSAQLKWRSGRIPKVEVAILHIDPVQRERVGLLRAEPDMAYPPHRHGGTEEIYMLSGDLTLEGITYYAGDYIRSAPGSTHSPASSAGGCMFFFRSSLDDEYPQ